MPKATYLYFTKNLDAQKELVLNLLNSTDISSKESSYGIPHIINVQKFLVKILIKLFIFKYVK